MTSREIVKAIMETKGVKSADMQYALQLTQQALWSRLDPRKNNGNLTTGKLNEMLRYLGYDLVIVPHGKTAKMADAYVVEDGDSK